MVPAGEITEQTVAGVAEVLEAGDAVIDGGNSYYHDDIRRAAELAERDIDYVDCGTSRGVFGLERGYCLMIGGPDRAVERLDPIFATLAPGVASAEAHTRRGRRASTAENGYLHCGPTGAGHFVKMIHNGIEWRHGRVRRRAQHPPQRRHGGARARARRRDRAARPPRVLPL